MYPRKSGKELSSKRWGNPNLMMNPLVQIMLKLKKNSEKSKRISRYNLDPSQTLILQKAILLYQTQRSKNLKRKRRSNPSQTLTPKKAILQCLKKNSLKLKRNRLNNLNKSHVLSLLMELLSFPTHKSCKNACKVPSLTKLLSNLSKESMERKSLRLNRQRLTKKRI